MAVNNFFTKLRPENNRLAGKEPVLQDKNRTRRSGLVLTGGFMFWGLLAAWLLFNLLAARFPARLNIDASDDQIYSLSEASQKIIQSLEQPVQVYALFAGGRRPTQPLDIYRYLEIYASSSPLIAIEEVDPELQPERIRPFIRRGGNQAPQRNSLIVFRPAGRFRVIRHSDLYYVMKRFGPKNAGIRAEQQISSAIAYVNGADIVRLGLLGGHREGSLATISPSFAQFNIQASKVELLRQPEALENLDVLLVYKPQLDLSERGYQHLRQYLGAGRKALWLVLDSQAEYLANFYRLAQDYGIEILEGLVLERDPERIQAASGYTTFVTPVSQLPRERDGLHPIIQPLQDNKISELLWVQSMAVRKSYPHARRLRFYKLVESSRASLLRRSRDPSSKARLPDDQNGPLTLMGMSVWQDEQGRRSGPALLVSFDAPGARSVFTTPSNRQLFYSALSWLGSDGNTLVFPSKSLLMLPLNLSQAQAIRWAIIFVVLLPLLVCLPGLLLLRQRNSL